MTRTTARCTGCPRTLDYGKMEGFSCFIHVLISLCCGCSAAEHGYEKHVALVQDKQHDVTLSRLGEVILKKGDWFKNDEMVSFRH